VTLTVMLSEGLGLLIWVRFCASPREEGNDACDWLLNDIIKVKLSFWAWCGFLRVGQFVLEWSGRIFESVYEQFWLRGGLVKRRRQVSD